MKNLQRQPVDATEEINTRIRTLTEQAEDAELSADCYARRAAEANAEVQRLRKLRDSYVELLAGHTDTQQ